MVALLTRLESTLEDPSSDPEALRAAFAEIDALWRDRVASLQDLLASPPPVPLALPPLQRDLTDPSYLELYARVQQQAEDVAERLQRARDIDLQGRAERLRRIVLLRGRILNRLRSLGSVLILDDPGRWASDALTEIASYPARKRSLFRLEIVDLGRRSPGDVAWTLNLVQEAGLALLVVLLPLLACRLAARSDGAGGAPALRATGWLGAWIVASLGGPLLEKTVAEALRPLPDLVASFAVYRLYLVFVDALLVPALDRVLVEEFPERTVTARRPLAGLGLLFLVRAWTLRSLLALAAPGVLLNTARNGLDLLVPLGIWLVAWGWRRELAHVVQRLVPAPAGPALASWTAASRTSWLVAPVAAVVVALLGTTMSLLGLLSRSEAGKQVSAGLLRRWMETALERDHPTLPPAPPEYRKAFLRAPVDPLEHWTRFLREVQGPLDRWLAGEEGEPVLTVHGPPRFDLEPLVGYLAGQYSGRLQVRELRPKGRIVTTEALREALGKLPDAPTLLLVPDAARLFLATVGGFEAWRELQVLVRRSQFVAFWVLLMGTPTRNYLTATAARDVGMARAVALPRWSDEALRRMILRRHADTGLAHRFDSAVALAARATPGATPESQFFQVLWQQSEGNPEVASELWLASLRLDPSGVLRVGLPPRNPAGLLASLPADVAFVLAALVRHSSLNLAELARTTALPERRVFLACERLLELGVLESEQDGRVGVTRRWLCDVLSFLEGRNLLDG